MLETDKISSSIRARGYEYGCGIFDIDSDLGIYILCLYFLDVFDFFCLVYLYELDSNFIHKSLGFDLLFT